MGLGRLVLWPNALPREGRPQPGSSPSPSVPCREWATFANYLVKGELTTCSLYPLSNVRLG